MSEKIKEILKKNACNNSSQEICGFIIERNGELNFDRCENISKDELTGFEINVEDFIARSKENILAVFHSHPTGGAKPSNMDMQSSEAIELPYIIYSLEEDVFQFYEPKFYRKNKFYIFLKKILL